MEDFIEIEIMNWDKFNPKRDQKTYSWFRMDNDLIGDPKLFGLDAEQKLVWIFLLCMASKSNRPTIDIDYDYIFHQTGVKIGKIKLLIEFLAKKSIISIRSSTLSRRGSTLSCSLQDTTPTNERTNERTNGGADTTATPELFLKSWNEHSGQLPKANGMSANRKKHAAARWQEKPDEGYWVNVIKILASSSFCQGDNDRGWRADLDFLLQPDTHLKALEGKYNSRSADKSKPTSPYEQRLLTDPDFKREQQEWDEKLKKARREAGIEQ